MMPTSAARVRHYAADALATVRHSGIALGYAAIVVVLAVTLAALPAHVAATVLDVSSTNLANLREYPLWVLVGSAFVTDGLGDLWVVPFLLVGYAYAQRTVGRVATVFVAVVGHVGATLAVATLIRAGIAHGALARSVERASDVGVSYGLACVGAFLVAAVPARWRIRYAVALVVAFVGPMAFGVTFTVLGHAIALTLGFGLALLATRFAAGRG